VGSSDPGNRGLISLIHRLGVIINAADFGKISFIENKGFQVFGWTRSLT